MAVFHNQYSFRSDGYGDERIDRKSVMTKIRNIYQKEEMGASYTDFFVNKYELSDEVNFLQLGQTDEIEYETITHTPSDVSKSNTWPTKDNRVTFKLNSVLLNLSQEQTNIERETYSLLEWIGDIGGLFDGLRLAASLFIAPVASYALKSELYIKLESVFSQSAK